MNAFKRKSLYTAVVAGLATVGASMNAGAVNLSSDGTGQVLLYPYYTTRNGFVTSFTVVNTNTFHTKVAKVRFLEGKNSAEVLDFNLWLSPRDVWTGSIVDTGTGAALYSADNSCTAPALGKTAAAAQPFVNYYYTGQVASTFYDNGGSGLDRTREGYIEVIEMAVVANAADVPSSPSTATGIALAAAVKHASTGIPANCAVVQVTTLFTSPDMLIPVGGLAGNYIVISGGTGTEFAHTPVAVENFQAPLFGGALVSGTQIYRAPGDLNPQLAAVAPDISVVFVSNSAGAPTVVTSNVWSSVAVGGVAIDAVSAIMMRSSVNNEYDVSPNFKTDMIITQPTKRFYVVPVPATAAGAAAASTAAIGPYANTFASATADGAKACDPVFPAAYDREEAPYSTVAGVTFSPVPAGGATGYGNLCWESTVMTIVPGTAGATAAAASVFASANSASLTLPGAGSSTNYASGWVSLWPSSTASTSAVGNNPGQFVSGGGASGVSVVNTLNAGASIGGLRNVVNNGLRYRGLPMIGFAATQALIGGQGYGGIFDNKYTRNINP
jgi:hypothetical protein